MYKQAMKKYKLTGDCFLGKTGDEVVIDWDGYDGAHWENLTDSHVGCPVSTNEMKYLQEVSN